MSQAALEAWRAGLERDGRRVPHFDPQDGGADARLLLLLESYGPRGTEVPTVSRDNPTGTSRNLARFLAEAGIARADTILWNAVPWIIHAAEARNRAPNRAEIAEGLALLPPFLALLPRLAVVVLAGRVAAEARPVVEQARPGLPILLMPHPSPTYVCTSPAVPERIRAALTQAAAILAKA